jgi:hypothetical protein
MMITLRRPAVCADCGANIKAGTRARWYRNGKVYGTTCHEQKPKRRAAYDGDYHEGEPLGLTYSRLDPYGAYTTDGTKIGTTTCGCEDYPCCGH